MDFFLIDRSSRLETLLESLAKDGPCDPVGIGFFGCRKSRTAPSNIDREQHSTRDEPSPKTAQKGIQFEASQGFLRKALLTEILAGRHSPLSQDTLFFASSDLPITQPTQKKTRPVAAGGGAFESSQLLRRWLLTGLQPLMDLVDEDVPLIPVNQQIFKSQTLAEALDHLLQFLFSKARDVNPGLVVFPIDCPLLIEFLYEILGPRGFGAGNEAADLNAEVLAFNALHQADRDLYLQLTVEQILRWAAMQAEQKSIVFYCQNTTNLETVIEVARCIKIDPSTNNLIRFRM
jgi:hypothetical protein